MSEKVSPLFLTRGVPGTHDTNLLFSCLKKIKKSNFSKILIPKFDKSIDDRLPKKKWQKVEKKQDIVIFEGWCVGVTPQKEKDLIVPLNELDKVEGDIKNFQLLVNSSSEINSFIKNPSQNITQQNQVINVLSDKLEFSKNLKNFFLILFVLKNIF